MLRTFFTLPNKGSSCLFLIVLLFLGLTDLNRLWAQAPASPAMGSPAAALPVETNNTIEIPGATSTNIPDTNPNPPPAPVVARPEVHPVEAPDVTVASYSPFSSSWLILASLMAFASVGGFLLYQCGLTRAKNCGHTSTLLLIGLVFGLIGYWVSGFAVQTGGIGDAHAALMEPFLPAEKSALDHELGFPLAGHHWGFMGSSGFFLIPSEAGNTSPSALFLSQAALLAIAVAAALGASLERGRLLAMAIAAFLIGAVGYPLVANWVWGGGWLAQLGRESGLGHGFVDLAGSGVVHEAAGTLALVIALVLGPRYGKFGRNNSIHNIPGHNMPFLLLGAIVLLLSWAATSALACARLPFYLSSAGSAMSSPGMAGTSMSLAAVNALLAAAGGLLISFLQASWRRQPPQPALLCRGLLGGVVSALASGALIDPWAAFVTGILAGLIVQFFTRWIEQRRIDDPTGAISVHGAAGAWGVLATGLFANGSAGQGINGIDEPVRGAISGNWHQLGAQFIGCVTCFVVVFILGYTCVGLIQKILGTRVELADEVHGLDWIQTGALGYQGDAEPEEIPRPEKTVEKEKEKAVEKPIDKPVDKSADKPAVK